MVRSGRRPYRTWEEWRTWVRRPLRPSCGYCWGQGRVYEPFFGELLPVLCPVCANFR
jgi:hypothetical protein